MLTLYIKDYPTWVGETIERLLISDYTLTGYYTDDGLIWTLLYAGDRDTRVLELAISEWIVN